MFVFETDIAATQTMFAHRQRKRKEAIGVGHGAKTRSLVKDSGINQRFSTPVLYKTAYCIGSYGGFLLVLRLVGSSCFCRAVALFQQHICTLQLVADIGVAKQCFQRPGSSKMQQRLPFVNFA